MKKKLLAIFMGILFIAVNAYSQQNVVTGRVISAEDNLPLPGVSVKVKGTNVGTNTGSNGNYSIRASAGQILVFTFVGTKSIERIVGSQNVIDVSLRSEITSLNEVVVTSLGQTTQKRALGTSQQTVKGADIAQTQRENFVNSLQGRIAGVDVTSTSGVPGASSSITIRGVSSISGSNQPLFIVDGLPIDNKTTNTSVFYSEVSSNTSQANRGTDFTNRSADINPEDIESLVVLKGPEAAALYGIDAANGAIVITTKRGKAGTGVIDYSNSFRVETPRGEPEIQRVYAPSTVVTGVNGSFLYFGEEYPEGTQFYDNIGGFFRTALTQKHNLAFSGGAEKVNYRISTSYTGQNGVVPNSTYDRITVTGASQATLNKWLTTDLSINYSYSNNDQPRKGAGGPLIGLLVWPQTDDAKVYLTPAGTRRQITTLGASQEVDNPYFSVNKNNINSKNNRVLVNFGLTITPFRWGNIKSNIGVDSYTNENLVLRHAESVSGYSYNGILDKANDITRNINVQNLFNINKFKITNDLSFDATLGQSLQDLRSNTDALYGESFLDPDFISVNNTFIRNARSTLTRRRLVSGFGRATLSYKDYLYVTATGRNDWTSTIPKGSNSFFYPSISGSFIVSDVPAFAGIKKYFTSFKLRAAYAEVGKDARPYAYEAALEYKATVGGGYGYGFTGPNPNLKPEFAKSYEVGTEMSFFKDRLGLDATFYRKKTTDQIVNDVRGSYATGYVLFNLNGAVTRNQGVEITLRGTPIKKKNLSWDVLTNFEATSAKVLSLPNSLPESYVSDSWLYGNVRNGVSPGASTYALTGYFYQRNDSGDILIDPTTGLPLRTTTFVDRGYDRLSDFRIGLTNIFTFKNISLSFLLDFRKGGDILNGTQHFLTTRGLSMETLDRTAPRVIPGVLRDGKENSATPTQNTIVVVPNYQTAYYTQMSEELYIEKDINWVRMRDVTLSYKLPSSLLKRQSFIKNASVFVTGTDLFLITNYSGLDPVVNGNSAAVGGSGGVGLDFGNFPIPMGINLGLKIGL